MNYRPKNPNDPGYEGPKERSSNRSYRAPKRRAGVNLAEPSTINQVLSQVLSQSALGNEIERYKFVRHWKEIVGPAVAERTKPECLRGRTLVVRVSNSAWAQELSFLKEDIVAKLNKFLADGEAVDDVTFYVAGN